MDDEDQVRPVDLSAIATDSVKHAIGRGRKRRAGRRGVSIAEIEIATSATATHPSQLHNLPYSKRVRTASSIILAHDEPDADSNDEWEEHVDLDQQTVQAAIDRSQRERSDSIARQSDPNQRPNSTGIDPARARNATPQLSPAEQKTLQRQKLALRRKKLARQHSLALMLLVSQLLRHDAAADVEHVRAHALSIMPDDLLDQHESDIEQLSRIALWARATFRPFVFVQDLVASRAPPSVDRLCNEWERIIAISQTCTGDIMDIASLVCASFRMHNFRCRVVSALQPASHQLFEHPDKVQKGSHRLQVVNARKEWEVDGVLYAWLEVWSQHKKKWLPLDICAGVVCEESPADTILDSMASIREYGTTEKKEHKRTRTGKSRQEKKRFHGRLRKTHISMMCHVVAVENGIVTDVTRRYVHDWSTVEKVRAKRNVFDKVVQNLGVHDPQLVDDEVGRLEKDEFDSISAGEDLPKTVSAVQKHPRYVLERHLKKYEAIYPKEPIVGYIKEEPMYLRSHVHLLHTKDRWIRQMREVAEGAAAIKSVKSKNGTEETVELFGEWQTHPLIIPECKDGVIPTSVHGNVDLWTPDHLPKGTVHINMPYAKAAAKKCGVEFAQAMTGFEIRGRRSVPKIEGVVVATENGNIVIEEAVKSAKAAAKRAEKKAREEACDRWRKLLRTMNAREKIRKKYGGALDESGTYESMQKRKGVRKALEEKHGRAVVGNRSSATDGRVARKVEELKEGGRAAESHEHEYGPPRCLQGDIWTKKCTSCGLDVTFEKL